MELIFWLLVIVGGGVGFLLLARSVIDYYYKAKGEFVDKLVKKGKGASDGR